MSWKYSSQCRGIVLDGAYWCPTKGDTLRPPYGYTASQITSGVLVHGTVYLSDTSGGYVYLYDDDDFSNAPMDGEWHYTNATKFRFRITPVFQTSFPKNNTDFLINGTIEIEYLDMSISGSVVTDSVFRCYVPCHEAPVVSFTFGDEYKSITYNDTLSLNGEINIGYTFRNKLGNMVMGLVALSGQDKEDWLYGHQATVTYNGTTRYYPENFRGSEMMTDTRMTVTYTVDGKSYSQRVACKFYDSFSLIYSTSLTGTPSQPLVVDASGITLNKAYMSATYRYHNNRFEDTTFTSQVSTVSLDGTDLLWSKSSFTQTEVEDLGGNPYSVALVKNTISPSQHLTASITVYLIPKYPDRLIINGSDNTARYYQGENSYFKTPSFTLNAGATKLFTLVYNDGSTIDLSASDLASGYPKYRLTANGANLTADSSIVPSGYTQLCIYIERCGWHISNL